MTRSRCRPRLKDEHLPVFDCASPRRRAAGASTSAATCEMMAAVQPFFSGAISKTCNIPAEATVEDIREPIWKAGGSASRPWRSTATAPRGVSR